MNQRPTAAPRKRKFVERRKKKKDWVNYSVTILSVLGWLGTFVILFFLDKASPGKENFFTRFLNAPVISSWNSQMLRTCLILLIAVFVICVIGFILNMTRHRRKTDRFNKGVITLGILSAAGIVAFVIRFWVYL